VIADRVAAGNFEDLLDYKIIDENRFQVQIIRKHEFLFLNSDGMILKSIQEAHSMYELNTYLATRDKYRAVEDRPI
jgi:hypothetical protein